MTKKLPKLTDKQKNALDEYIANPKISKSEAIRRSYDIQHPKSAGAMVPKTFNTPQAKRYMEIHANRARDRIVELMEQNDKPELALKAAIDILDRTDGKATQKTLNQTQKVTIVADFTGGSAGERPSSPSSDTPVIDVSPSSADD